MAAHIIQGLATLMFAFPRVSQVRRNRLIRSWDAKVLKIFAMRMKVDAPHGFDLTHPKRLYIGNHISWIDVYALQSVTAARFVAKSELAAWPVLGTLTTAGGTLYIERESRRDAMRVVHHMSEALAAGDIVAVFPEGTTGNGVDLLPFHANLLQAAIAVDAPVQPIALSFKDAATGQTSQAASFVGDETLLGSLWNTLKSCNLAAVATYGVPQSANGRDRRTWAADLSAEIASLKALP